MLNGDSHAGNRFSVVCDGGFLRAREALLYSDEFWALPDGFAITRPRVDQRRARPVAAPILSLHLSCKSWKADTVNGNAQS